MLKTVFSGLATLSLCACGSSEDGGMLAPSAADSMDAPHPASGSSGDTASGAGALIADEPEAAAPGAGAGSAAAGGPSSGEECAVQTQRAMLSPVHLLFLLDQSGSMGDGQHGKAKQKWDPVSLALKAFFSDAQSSGLQASLTLFPPDINTTTQAASSGQSSPASCEPGSYQAPQVPMTKLPQQRVFAEAIEAITPPNEWGTPTAPAMEGIVQQAEALQQSEPGAKVAIVLVTDGEPHGCSQNSVDSVAELAAGVSGDIPTYVIGVGNKLNNLNRIAEGGATGEAFIVAVDDPSETRRALLDTFSAIRGQVIACDAPIPEPPEGKLFEKENVAVELTLAGNVQPVQYSQDCAGGQGWRYDDPASPAVIELCPASCGALQQQQDGALDVVFACQPQFKLAK